MPKNIFLTALLLSCFFVSPAQKRSSTLLKQALQDIEALHNVEFSYADDLIDNLLVTLPVEKELNSQLEHIESQTGLAFEATGNIILVKPVNRSFCLRVIDSQSKAPLQGAQIVVNGNVTNKIADKTGSIKFNAIFNFQDTIAIIYFGYDTRQITAKELINDCPDVKLNFGETTLDAVVISHYISSGFNANQEDHHLEIKTDNLALLPGETDGDILLAIKTLPGITAPSGKAGNLHLRGSTTDQTLVLFDNIPIYHKGHYLGAISPYNPQLVDQVNVYRSGYGPDLGGRVGGAIELQSSRRVADSLLLGVGVNTYYATAMAQAPVIADKMSVSGSIRSSFTGSYRSPKLEAINELVFQPSIVDRAENDPNQTVLKNQFVFRDANFNTNYEIKDGNISLSLLHIHNDQKTEIERPRGNELVLSKINTSLDNNGANLSWDHYWNADFYTTFSSAYSKYEYTSTIKEDLPDGTIFIADEFENQIKDFYVGADANFLLNIENDSRLTLGYQFNRHEVINYNFTERFDPPRTAYEFETGYLHTVFANHKIQARDKLIINSGLRASYYNLTENIRVEPRLFLNYELNDIVSFKSSAGMYSQYINQNVFFDFEDSKVENLRWDLASEDRKIVKSDQYMLGALVQPGSFLFDLEVYYKEIENLATIIPGPQLVTTYGDLNVYGLDFLVRKSWGKIDTWISYGYTVTEMDFPSLNQQTFETYYDQPHAVNINASLPFNNWKFSIGWQYLSGVPVYTDNTFFPTPGNAGGPGGPSTIPSEENDGRFPAQHQLDLSVVFMFPKNTKPWNGTIGLSLLNVYDRNNLVATNYIRFGPNTNLEDRYAIGFAPNLMLNIKF